MTERPAYIAVCGGGAFEEKASEAAREVGKGLALQGAVVLCGGLGGVMEAVCEGARSEGGLTIGFLPGNERAAANEFVDIALPTGLGEMRNMLLVRASDAVVAVSGEFGTLSEIAYALRIGVPVIGLNTWSLSKDGEPREAIVAASSPEEAVRLALDAAGS
ncbi:MAG TPA: TIGR00725 family protein [Actinomycetota bacterium]|nr:TIGR00725 family protein [Actinomycetota bacterium]